MYWGPQVAAHTPSPLPRGLKKPGRLVLLTAESLPGVNAPEDAGWQFQFSAPPERPAPKSRKERRERQKSDAAAGPRTDAPATAATLATDTWARKFLPARHQHAQFFFSSMPTWILTPRVNADESPEGWWAVLDETSRKSLFLVRIPPRRGKLPGQGWRNILAHVVKQGWNARIVPIPGLPSPQVLAQSVAWEYRVDAGPNESDLATWDLQILPSRGLLSSWLGRSVSPWEATAHLRWLRPGATSAVAPTQGKLDWATLLAALPAPDARLLVQNVLLPADGGVSAVADLLFSLSADGKSRPRKELPLAWLSTLFPRRQWAEIERASRSLPPGDPEPRRAELLDAVEARLSSGALLWSAESLARWEAGYRVPRREALARELAALSGAFDWGSWYQQPALVLEGVLRSLDVTDLALCLEKAPDARWRRFVTKRRDDELRLEAEFCRIWRSRGDLSLERELDAWQSFLEETRKFATLPASP